MASMPVRKLGKNGPSVNALGFGAMGLSAAYGKTDEDETRFAVLDRALELGSTFWDTSDAYGDNEDLIGAWFKRTGKRDQIFLCTKFGIGFDKNREYVIHSDPEYIKRCCDQSLKRLGVDKIDLYYCHRVDTVTPIEKTVAAMVELKNQGKIDAIGLSEVSAATIRRAEKVHHIDAIQLEYSPFALDIEDSKIDVLRTCRDFGIATVAYSPLGRGFLTGQIKSPDDFDDNDFRKQAPRFSNENFAKNLDLVTQLKSIAQKKGCTSGQLSLSWLLAQGDDIIPIPGTKKIKYLEENVGSVTVKLTAEENAEIRKAIENTAIAGTRYAAHLEQYCFADTAELAS